MKLSEGTYTVYEEVMATRVYRVHLDGETHLEELLVAYGELCYDAWDASIGASEEVALIVNDANVVVWHPTGWLHSGDKMMN